MHTVIDPFAAGGVETVKTSGSEDEAPAAITTTLYDLIAALQEVVPPGEEALVVATVVSLLRAGRIRPVAPFLHRLYGVSDAQRSRTAQRQCLPADTVHAASGRGFGMASAGSCPVSHAVDGHGGLE